MYHRGGALFKSALHVTFSVLSLETSARMAHVCTLVPLPLPVLHSARPIRRLNRGAPKLAHILQPFLFGAPAAHVMGCTRAR